MADVAEGAFRVGTKRVIVRVDRGTGAIAVFEGGDYSSEAYAAGETLAGLGSPPAWWPLVVQIREVLARCPQVPVADLFDFVGKANRDRVRVARAVDVWTPEWLCWAMRFDPHHPVAAAFMNAAPVEVATILQVVCSAESDPRLAPLMVRRGVADPATIRASVEEAIRQGGFALHQVMTAATTPRSMLPAIAEACMAGPSFYAKNMAALVTLDENTARVLMEHPSAEVRARVAANRGTPEEIRRTLAQDSDPEVVRAARTRPSEPRAGR